jgi:hypothetical protein
LLPRRPPERSAASTLGAVVVLVALVAGSAQLAGAMAMYPGGSAIDPRQLGHSFWLNFLCDLTESLARNGTPNPVGSLLGRSAITTYAVGFGAFWMILPVSFGVRGHAWTVMRVMGVLSAAGLALVPFATGWLHAWSVALTSLPGVCAGILGLVGTIKYARSRFIVGVVCAAIAAAVADSVLYRQSLATHPRVVIPALPIVQRLTLLLILTWGGAVALQVLRLRRDVR